MVYLDEQAESLSLTPAHVLRIKLAMSMLIRATRQRNSIPKGDKYFEAILEDNHQTDKEILGL